MGNVGGKRRSLAQNASQAGPPVGGGLAIAFVWAAIIWTVGSAGALSMTFDEPHHLATGIEWWQFGTYRWWTENPPLPKVVTALGPFLAGVRLPGSPATLGSRP